MWRKTSRQAPRREQHPDPIIEAQLQRILAMQAGVGRLTDLTGQYRKEIGNLHYTAQEETSTKRIAMYLEEAATLHTRILETEESISQTSKQIAELTAELSETELSYLQ
jgi:Mg2+ and Co2+ transporter CorA